MMRQIQILFFFLVALSLSACGATGEPLKSMTTSDQLPQRPFFAGKVPVSTGMGTYWVTWGEGSDSPNQVVSESSEPAENTPQVLLTGRIIQNSFAGGKFQIHLKGSTPCDGGPCADMESQSLASQVLTSPGFYSLVAPRSEQSVTLVVSYLPDSGEGSTQELPLGVIEQRRDDLDFDFTPPPDENPNPDPDPTPPGPGATDLSANP